MAAAQCAKVIEPDRPIDTVSEYTTVGMILELFLVTEKWKGLHSIVMNRLV